MQVQSLKSALGAGLRGLLFFVFRGVFWEGLCLLGFRLVACWAWVCAVALNLYGALHSTGIVCWFGRAVRCVLWRCVRVCVLFCLVCVIPLCVVILLACGGVCRARGFVVVVSSCWGRSAVAVILLAGQVCAGVVPLSAGAGDVGRWVLRGAWTMPGLPAPCRCWSTKLGLCR